MFCIETENLHYRFSADQAILKNIHLRVPDGSIYGFLGPNGAGKTTTLRLLLGLLRKQTGRISFFGKPLEDNRISILRQTGSLIESPSFYAHLTASENLEVMQKIYQCRKSRIEEVLKIVGLPDTGNKKAGKFSLGMKQRLGIAVAMLHQPRLLILDELTNGLDPNGIIEMRDLLKTLNRDQGMTILISSHLLAEIEKLVSHLGIIHQGSILFQGTLNELQEKQQHGSSTILETSDNQKAALILQTQGLLASHDSGILSFPVIGKTQLARLNKQLVMEGIDVYQMQTISSDLESIFMNMVQN